MRKIKLAILNFIVGSFCIFFKLTSEEPHFKFMHIIGAVLLFNFMLILGEWYSDRKGE